MPKLPIPPLFVAFWFFLSAGVLTYRFRNTPQVSQRLRPVAFYLVGIGTFFVMKAVAKIATTSCPVWDCTNLVGGIAIMLAATFIARFPIRHLWPDTERLAFWSLAVVSITSQAALALRAPAIQMRVAQGYAFLLAGVFTIGFLVYESVRRDSTTGLGIGLSLTPCCVVGHGLALLAPTLVVSLPLVGVPLAAPMVSAALAPIALIVTVLLVASVEPDATPGAEGQSA